MIDDLKQQATDLIAHEDWVSLASMVHEVNDPKFTRFVLEQAHWYGAVFS